MWGATCAELACMSGKAIKFQGCGCWTEAHPALASQLRRTTIFVTDVKTWPCDVNLGSLSSVASVSLMSGVLNDKPSFQMCSCLSHHRDTSRCALHRSFFFRGGDGTKWGAKSCASRLHSRGQGSFGQRRRVAVGPKARATLPTVMCEAGPSTVHTQLRNTDHYAR